jgi:hypothetical protein
LRVVVGRAEDEFGRAVAPGADVGEVGLAWVNRGVPLTSCLAEPKSEMTIRCLYLSTRMFWGLMSRWAMASMLR